MALKMHQRKTKRVEVTSSLTTETRLNPPPNEHQTVTTESSPAAKTPPNPPSHGQKAATDRIMLGEVEKLADLLAAVLALGDAKRPPQIKNLSSAAPHTETGVESTPIPDSKAAGDVDVAFSLTVEHGVVEKLADLLAAVLALGEAKRPQEIKNLSSAPPHTERGVESTPMPETQAAASVKVASSMISENPSEGHYAIKTAPSPTDKTPPNPLCHEEKAVTRTIFDGEHGEVEKLADLMAAILTLGEASSTPFQETNADDDVKVASSLTGDTRLRPPQSGGQQSVTTEPSSPAKTSPHPPCKEQNVVTDTIIDGGQGEVEKLADLMADILTFGEASSTPIQETNADDEVKVASSLTGDTRLSLPLSGGQQSVTTEPSPTAKTPLNPPCKEQNAVTDPIIDGEKGEVENLADLMADILTFGEASDASSLTVKTPAISPSDRENAVITDSSLTVKTPVNSTSDGQQTVTTDSSLTVKAPVNSTSDGQQTLTTDSSLTVKVPAISPSNRQNAVGDRDQSIRKRKRPRRRFLPAKKLKSALFTPVEIEIQSLARRFCALSV